MIRRAAIIVVALTLNPILLRAQNVVFTVDAPSADVHRGPSMVNPVIGHVPRGTVLPVSRNLGSWVRVPWRAGEDGFAYVHISSGHIGPLKSAAVAAKTPERSSPATPTARTIPPPAPPPPAPPPQQRLPVERPAPATVIPASHTFGVGGLAGSVDNFGATARAWHGNRIGIQFGVMRDAIGSSVAPGRVTSMQVEPGVVYGLFDRVTDYVWIRPYVGSAVNFNHETLNVITPTALPPSTDNGVGLRLFGGAEFMFASAPRFGLTADLGYRRLPTPFAGFEHGPLSATIGGHWYIK